MIGTYVKIQKTRNVMRMTYMKESSLNIFYSLTFGPEFNLRTMNLETKKEMKTFRTINLRKLEIIK